MINYKIVLEYDGSRYNGWQRQGNTDNTIQGKLEQIISRYFDQTVEIHGSGRTDAGVHAIGQVANFKINPDLVPVFIDIHNLSTIHCDLNTYLPEDIRITDISIVDSRFHARLNAVSKVYQYRISLTNKKNVFDRKYCATITEALNIELMKDSAKSFLGQHDYAPFSDTKTKKSTVRYVKDISFNEITSSTDHYLIVDFTGNGFLYHTVRLMMGTLIKIGAGQCPPSIIEDIFNSGNRKLVPFMAPAEGLTLVKVEYDS
jgi:tRNA pseudouridine38-40 synthase